MWSGTARGHEMSYVLLIDVNHWERRGENIWWFTEPVGVLL